MAAPPNPQNNLKMVSQSEYNLLEEWAPQALNDYSCVRRDNSPAQEHQCDVRTLPKRLQRNPSPEQTRQRSSSVYEEWKAQVSCPRVNSAVPVGPRAALSDVYSSDVSHSTSKAAQNSHTENKNAKDRPHLVVGKVITNDQKPSSKNTGHSGRSPKPSNRNSESHNQKKTNKQPYKTSNSNKPNASHGPEFVAPNGTRICAADLGKLAIGVEIQNGDKAYFLPSFIADPWSDMKPIETMCFPRNDSTPSLERGALAIFIGNL